LVATNAQSSGAFRVEPAVLNDDSRSATPNPSDSALVTRVAHGDVIAFGMLYDRYSRAIYALAVHLLGSSDAEEAVQEIFLHLWNSARLFDETRGSSTAWFMTIARNHAFHELKHRNRRNRFEAAEDIDRLLARTIDKSGTIEDQAWVHKQQRAAVRALSDLPAEQRTVLVLAYFSGLSQAAIAQHRHLPLGTVKKRTRLGLEKLRRAMIRERLTNDAAGVPDDSRASAQRARITNELQ
jgi:RNA polymerase sigma-70 factor (ECF subfamily)